MIPLDRSALDEAIIAAASPDVRAVLDDEHEVERLGGQRVWLGLEYEDENGQPVQLDWQPRKPVRSCQTHGQEQCSQCRNGAWLQAGRRMPQVSPVEAEVLDRLCAPTHDDTQDRVRAALVALGDADTQVAWLKAAGLVDREAAEMLGISHEAYRVRLHRLRKKLAGCNTNGHSYERAA